MNWEAIGAIGDLMGGLVVIVSVAYLAVQIRQSNRHAEASTEATWLHGLNEIWDRWSVESTMVAIRKGMADFDALSKNEQAVFQMQVGALVNHCMTAEQLWQRRLIAEETRAMPRSTSWRGSCARQGGAGTGNSTGRLHPRRLP